MSATKARQPQARQRRRAVKLFYCGTSFYTKNLHKEWMPITDGVAKHYLIRGGFRGGKSEHTLTEADNHLLTVRERDCVAFAGPVAGQKTGLLVTNGERVLVTRSAQLPIAKKGPFPNWEAILEPQFGEQLDYLLEWHKQAYLRVLNSGGPFLPALAIAGASGSGKSMLGLNLTTPLLGGRSANPFRYMSNDTPHNAEVCGSELLLMDDPVVGLKSERLAFFRGELKRTLASPTDSLHPKGTQAYNVKPVRAVLICMNDKANFMRFLDFSDETMNDKLILLRVLGRPACLPDANDFDAERALETKLRKEIPHLLWHLLHVHKLPVARQWKRGSPCYRDAELLSLVQEDDAVTRVLWLMGELPRVPSEPLAAPEWDRRLRSELGELAVRVLDNGARPLSLGHVLRDAAKRVPDQVECAAEKAHGNLNKWRVKLSAKVD